MEQLLDNPAWWALNSHHAIFAEGTDRARRYRAEILPFIAFHSPEEGAPGELDPWMRAGESFFIIGELPPLPAGWNLEYELPCAQMLGPSGPEPDETTERAPDRFHGATAPAGSHPDAEAPVISLLGAADREEMFDLINTVQPGYYYRDTRLLGTYYGIRQEGRLVSMAGERMRPGSFSELSAICTHPAYTGRKYAQELIAHLCRMQYAAGIVPFLHVALTNTRALRLYEHMGFTHRRRISFWKVKKG